MGCRFPRGKRGLKLINFIKGKIEEESLPSREAWIEIFPGGIPGRTGSVASLAGSVD